MTWKVQRAKGKGQSREETGDWRLETGFFSLRASSLKPQALPSSFPIPFFLLLLPCFFLIACGHKTPVRPPEWVAPEAISDLSMEIDPKPQGVVLRWGRPQTYVDGSEMDDLGGFVVLRATQEGQEVATAFSEVARVVVEDRDRFRKAKKFTYTDKQLTAGVLYRYRVQAFTLDGYYSSQSNTAEVVWKGGP